ncbi:hypothetical protein [Caldiplasma sukawensis]
MYLSPKERSKIIQIISKYIQIRDVEDERGIPVIKSSTDIKKDVFRKIYFELRGLKYKAMMTSSDEIVVLNSKERRTGVFRYILLIATIISILYSGYIYSSGYYESHNFYGNILSSLIYFELPILGIMFVRELPKYVIRKKNGLRYDLPLFIPDPIFMGTLGLINSQSEDFLDSDEEMKAGVVSLMSSFIFSIVLLFIGVSGLSFSKNSVFDVNAELSVSSYPLMIRLLSSRLFTMPGSIDPIAMSGIIGLIFTSFNTFPIGSMDGSYVLSKMKDSQRRILSYVFITALFFICFTFPSWYILLLFIVITGLEKPSTLYFSREGMGIKSGLVAGTVLALIVLGFNPYPVHVSSPQFNVFLSQPCYSSMVGSPMDMAYYNVSIENTGPVSIAPAFYIQGEQNITVKSAQNYIQPGKFSCFTVEFNSSNLAVGFNSINLYVIVGSASKDAQLRLLNENRSHSFYIDDGSICTLTPTFLSTGDCYSITVVSLGNKNITDLSIAVITASSQYFDITIIDDRNSTINITQNGTWVGNGIIDLMKDYSQYPSTYVKIYTDLSKNNMEIAIYNQTYNGILTWLE